MRERWVPHFVSMLRRMESLGSLGSSRTVGIVSDGDGDFRPTFDFSVNPDPELSIGERHLQGLQNPEEVDRRLQILADWQYIKNPVPGKVCVECGATEGLGLVAEQIMCRNCMKKGMTEMLSNPDGYVYDAG